MKKRVSFLTGVVVYLALAILFSGYGNRKVHRSLNTEMIDSFSTNFLNGIFTLDKFKNYTILFNGSLGFSGPAVTTGGYLTATETGRNYNLTKWLEEGGYSADEPELPASFRHFYDPTEPEGQRYLKDHLDYLESVIEMDFNPRVDQVEWAISHPDNDYSFGNGVEYVRQALESHDTDTRNENMAKAYRCLGQTLHMIADMGCPAHVRDDSHPAPFENYPVISYFGSPDPYEELFETLLDKIPLWSDANVDVTLKAAFNSAGTVGSIARRLAYYTNRNFFTNQTISANGVIPQIHPEKTYSSPKLEDCSYNEETCTFSKMISGKEVKMCKDLVYLWKIIPDHGYPYIDYDCVVSQGEVLVPQITEAGANVIRLFIPTMEVSINSFSGGYLEGKVTHKTDSVYTMQIMYNGTVDIYRVDDLKKLGTLDAINGSFEGDISATNETKLIAQISFGDITVKSPEFTGGKFLNFSFSMNSLPGFPNLLQLRNGDITLGAEIWGVYIDGYDDLLTWSGNNFSVERIYGGNFPSHIIVTGEFEPSTSLLKHIEIYSAAYDYEESVNFQNIPMITTDYGSHFELTGAGVENYVTEITYKDIATGAVIESINWPSANLIIELY